MKKLVLFLMLCLLGSLSVRSANRMQRILVHCETAGSLLDSLAKKGYTDLTQITSLTVSGHLHAGD